MRRIRKTFEALARQERDPRYMFVLIGSGLVFFITCLQALSNGLFDSVERPMFEYVNTLPRVFHEFFYLATQFGGLGSLVLWLAAAWYLINRRAAISLAVTGTLAWTLAKVTKVLVHRGRPEEILEDVKLFQEVTFGGYGFPSGHATFSAACAAILYYQVPSKYRKYLLWIVLLVGISRMYLGAHFPLDIVGGWALGAFIGAVVSLAIGSSTKGISITRLRRFLKDKDYQIKKLSFARVDARGSKPLYMELQDGQEYFGKIFGKQEHAADWLFKLFRFFRYKNLQAEEPYTHSRRNVEMESFAMLWAREANIRVPKVIDLLRFDTSWILIQEKIDAKPLSDHGHVLQKSLIDAWKQVDKLHKAKIAHRDLRAANLMIDKLGKVWMIDFGFAEVSARKQRQYMDIAELLMSMSLVVGVERTLDAATGVIDRGRLAKALPYLQMAVFSGATTKQLKQNKSMLNELRTVLKDRLNIEEHIEDADILRINGRKALNIALLAIFLYIIAPQFSEFRHAFSSVEIHDTFWLLPIGLSSLMTYVFAGGVYASLAQVPLKVREATLVQLAASFMSKVLPGGVGSTGLNLKYLNKAGMDTSDSSAIIAAQGVIGFIMFSVPLALFLLINGQGISELMNFNVRASHIIAGIIAVIVVAVLLIFIKRLRSILSRTILRFVESIRNITTPGRELALASASSLGVTLAYVACLYFSFRAFDLPLGLAAAVFVYASAVIARSVIPTPGGLGPLEAAMIAAMITLGAGKEEAFATVIVYRLATFWVPIPFSLLSYKYLSSKKLI